MRRGISCSFVLLVGTIGAAAMPAQTANWTLAWGVGLTTPFQTWSHAMAYDSQRGFVMRHGGVTTGAFHRWDGVTWTPVVPIGPSPSARYAHAMVYDSVRDRLVLYGGFSGVTGTTPFQDTWEWDGSAWAMRSILGPGPRLAHAMVYDRGRGVAVLFGGEGAGYASHHGDTWEWDGSGWGQVAVVGPSARNGHVMAFDALRSRTVLFGGYDANNAHLDDTWEWDGLTWQPALPGLAPPAGRSAEMCYDSARGVCVLFDVGTWTWNGASWAEWPTVGPGWRLHPAVAYDSARGVTVLDGGAFILPGLGYAETWEWDGMPTLSGTAAAYGTGCGSPPLVLQITAQRPIVGSTAQLTLQNTATGPAVIAAGFSDTSRGSVTLPLALGSYGMPGCSLLTSAEFLPLPTVGTGANTARFDQAIPTWIELIGVPVFLQAATLAPGANAAGTIVSNGVHWVIGSN